MHLFFFCSPQLGWAYQNELQPIKKKCYEIKGKSAKRNQHSSLVQDLMHVHSKSTTIVPLVLIFTLF